MKTLIYILLLILSGGLAQAQQKPEPKTKLETFQARTGSVVVKNYSEIGSVTGIGSASINSYEFVDAQTSKREYGIGIIVKGGGRIERESSTYVDYDEIDSLLKGLDYISKVTKEQSKLKNFEAHYKTLGDLDVSTFSSRETIASAVTVRRLGDVSVYFELDQLAKFRQLIVDAKAALDAVK
jgi:hypothetical protein